MEPGLRGRQKSPAERKGREGPAALGFPGEREPVRSTCTTTGRQERGEPSEAGASASAGGRCTCRTGVTWGQETRSWEALKAIIGGWGFVLHIKVSRSVPPA